MSVSDRLSHLQDKILILKRDRLRRARANAPLLQAIAPPRFEEGDRFMFSSYGYKT